MCAKIIKFHVFLLEHDINLYHVNDKKKDSGFLKPLNKYMNHILIQ